MFNTKVSLLSLCNVNRFVIFNTNSTIQYCWMQTKLCINVKQIQLKFGFSSHMEHHRIKTDNDSRKYCIIISAFTRNRLIMWPNVCITSTNIFYILYIHLRCHFAYRVRYLWVIANNNMLSRITPSGMHRSNHHMSAGDVI